MKIYLFLTIFYLRFTITHQQNKCLWRLISDSYSSGGILQNINNLEECKYVCVQRDSCRYGFNWHEEQKTCILSTNPYTVKYPGMSNYVYDCSVLSWLLSANRNSPGGVLQPIAQTLAECKNICMFKYGCALGLDWVKYAIMGQQCYLSERNMTTDFNGVDHWTPTKGQGSPDIPYNDPNCTWTSYPNSNSPGGVPKPRYNLTECQIYCRNNSCPGIDWDSLGSTRCYISTNNMIFKGTFQGVTHYSYSCPNTGASPPGAGAGIPSTRGMPCDYVLYADSRSTGGDQRTYSSETECRNQCSVQQNCKAYEWRERSTTNNCVLHDTDQEPVYKGNQIGYRYYIFRKCT